MFNNIYTKIKKLFNTKVVVEPKTKKRLSSKAKYPEYTMWVLPTTLEEEDISNQYQWGSSDMVNIHLTKEDIEELSYIWSTESKEIIDTINSRTNPSISKLAHNLFIFCLVNGLCGRIALFLPKFNRLA